MAQLWPGYSFLRSALRFADRFRAELQTIKALVFCVKTGRHVKQSLKNASWSAIEHCKDLVENIMDIAKPVARTVVLQTCALCRFSS